MQLRVPRMASTMVAVGELCGLYRLLGICLLQKRF